MDHLGREVYLYPFWVESNLKEQDESSLETVYDDFYTRLEVAERLFDLSCENLGYQLSSKFTVI